MDEDINLILEQLKGVNLYLLKVFTLVRRSEHYDISCSISVNLPAPNPE